MENLKLLEKCLKVLFRRYPAQRVLQNCMDEPGITREEYVQLAFPHTGTNRRNLFSREDLQNQWQYYQECMEKEAVKQRRKHLDSKHLNPIECLFYYVDRTLVVQDNQVVCRYERLMNWQMLTLSVSQELLVAAFWAMKKMPEEMTLSNFSWKLVLGHDNFQLNRIFERGLAENHFHLYGSAPVFQLAWISLMNVLTGSKAAANLSNYDKKRLDPRLKSDTTMQDVPLSVQHYQAALIRLVLFSYLTGHPVLIGPPESYKDEADSCDCDELAVEDIERACGLDGLMRKTVENLVQILQGDAAVAENNFFGIKEQISDVQDTINSFRDWYGDTLPDYAMLALPGWSMGQEDIRNSIFQGERWLLYRCLNLIYYQELPPGYTNLFYAYLLIKEQIRHELLQTDDKVGFSHFQDYERRKFDLIDDHIYHGAVGMAAWAAVRENLLNDNIYSLEIRITPYLSTKENIKQIKTLDKIIGEEKEKYFYTLHFLKREDDWKKKDPEVYYCRHDSLRRRTMQQVNSILEMREKYPEYAQRIRGIDAASRELFCRPEVFAVAFRLLHFHTVENEESIRGGTIPQIRRTYHVGEDFQDIVDGIRAIEEAIQFLNLESGDRLGHAIALGVDVREWYRAKSNMVSLTKQQYLDDVVWLYHKLVRYGLDETKILQESLKRQYSIRFRELYLKHMPLKVMDKILKEYWHDRKITGEQRWDGSGTLDFDIYQYYQAWKLRGDDPRLYEKGYFCVPDPYTFYERSRVNKRFPEKFGTRFVPEVFLIHYFYHYSKAIREEGEEIVQVPVNSDYIEGVALVQKEFQREVGRMGLAIETNPTSNFKVSTFKRYDRHPILNFYNRNLEVNSEKLEQNPQLLVSINTDDQGVFSTSLENEYSLMACALEKAHTEDGRKIYPRQRVYAWLNEIRLMGLEQTFGRTPKECCKKKSSY